MHLWSILIWHYNTIALDQDAMEDYGIFLLSQPSQELHLHQRGVQTIQYENTE